jgi:hypothetical protein
MFRFRMPKMIGAGLKEQCAAFLRSDALKELFSVLGTDRASFLENQRTGIVTVEDPDKKVALYPLLDELGFFGINVPLYPAYDHILVLGGLLDACFERTAGAAAWITESTLSVDALTTPRRIEERERTGSRFHCSAATEEEALGEAFRQVFHTEPYRIFSTPEDGTSAEDGERSGNPDILYRIFSTPFGTDGRRADTGETFRYYLEKAKPAEGSTILAVTHNRYCNRQFLQLSHDLLREHLPVNLDMAGVVEDERIVPAQSYDPSAFLRDLSGVRYWAERILHDEEIQSDPRA